MILKLTLELLRLEADKIPYGDARTQQFGDAKLLRSRLRMWVTETLFSRRQRAA